MLQHLAVTSTSKSSARVNVPQIRKYLLLRRIAKQRIHSRIKQYAHVCVHLCTYMYIDGEVSVRLYGNTLWCT